MTNRRDLRIKLVRNGEFHSGYGICVDENCVPASIYEIALWKMYQEALEEINAQEALIEGLTKRLNKLTGTVDDTTKKNKEYIDVTTEES